MTEQKIGEQSFELTGMDCADCARSIEKGVSKLAGVQACSINFTAARLRVNRRDAAGRNRCPCRELGYDVKSEADKRNRQPGIK